MFPVSEKYAHPEFMTAQQQQVWWWRWVCTSRVTLYHARGFLYHSIGCNLHFTGTGYTPQDDQEYLVPNARISEKVPGVVVVDLDVRMD